MSSRIESAKVSERGREKLENDEFQKNVFQKNVNEKVSNGELCLIEDDMDIREAILDVLESEGYRACFFENGEEGLNYLKRSGELPGLILLDLMMPIMNGHEFLTQKCNDLRLKKVPVVVMTADVFALNSPESLPSAVAFMRKPLDINKFLDIAHRYLKPAESMQLNEVPGLRRNPQI